MATVDGIEVDSKFDLDPQIYRSAEQRCAMVEDVDCPQVVLRIIATHDEDQIVLQSIYFRDDFDELEQDIIDIVNERIEGDKDELDKAKNLRFLETKDERWKVFCTIPWNHIATNADGSVRMCCQMTQPDVQPLYGTLKKEDGSAFTGSDDPEDYRNHPDLKEIRSAMLKGIDPSICKLCTLEEKGGMFSRRNGSKKRYPDLFEKAEALTAEDGSIDTKDFPLQYLDLRFGNKCNLKCRSCGPTDSNLWYGDFYKITEKFNMPKGRFRYRDHDTMTITKDDKGKYDVEDMTEWWEDSGLWNHIINNVEHIDRYYFTGGEPTINLKHRELLDLIIKKGIAGKVNLEYNTNMAGIPSRVFEQWKHFKHIGIGMSLDGIFEHFEYLRHPGKWATAERAVRKLDTTPGLNNTNPIVALTLSIYNVLHVLDMIWWWKEQSFNRVIDWINISNLYGPFHMNIQNMPNTAKQYVDKRYRQFMNDLETRFISHLDDVEILNKNREWLRQTTINLNAVLDHMWAKEYDPEQWQRFFTMTKALDEIRDEKFEDSCPELVQIFKEAYEQETRARSAKLASAGKKR